MSSKLSESDLLESLVSDSIFSVLFQKQPLADVFQNRCSQKFRYVHKETPVVESLYNKVAGL